MVVTACHGRGIHDFGLAHDCYSCHAAHVDVMRTVIKEQFCALHSVDLLAELARDIRKRHPDEIFDNPPKRGTLDINSIALSKYAFN
jgi:DNA-directed RNA polymerase